MKLSMSFSEFLNVFPNILPILIPIFILLFVLMLTAVISLLKKELPFSQKVIWLIVILCVSLIGPVIYFAVGSKMLDEKIQNRNEGR